MPRHPQTDGDDPTEAQTDGGQAEASPLDSLDTPSKRTATGRDRLNRFVEQYLYSPTAVLWDDWRARIGGAIVSVYLFAALFGRMLVEETYTNEGPRLLAPFDSRHLMTLVDTGDLTLSVGGRSFTFSGLHIWEFPFGTDKVGADLFAQTVYSTQPVMAMVLAGGLFTVVVGTTIGLVAGYKGGILDEVLSTITDIFLNIPGLPLVIVLAGIFTPSNPFLIGILLSVASWAGLARSIRSQVLTLRNENFSEASRAMGLPSSRIIARDILPHLMPYISVSFVKAARDIIFSAVGLYFIGVLPFSAPNWGVTLNLAYTNGAMYLMPRVHWLIVPIVAIVGLSMGLILLAQSLDRVFNPRVRAKHTDADTAEDEDQQEGNVHVPFTP